jgi:hypothetical protein
MLATADTPATAGSQQQQHTNNGRTPTTAGPTAEGTSTATAIAELLAKKGLQGHQQLMKNQQQQGLQQHKRQLDIRGANNIRMDARTFGNTSSRRDVHRTLYYTVRKNRDTSNIGDASNSRDHKKS